MGFPYLIFVEYYALVIALVLFSISFATQKFMKNQNVYFTFIFSLVIIGIIFGGAFNDYFGSYLDENGNSHIEILWDGSPSLFLESFYIVSIFSPFYSPSAIITEMTTNYCGANANLLESAVILFNGNNWNIFKFLDPRFTDTTFTFTVWLPYIYVVLGFIVGIYFLNIYINIIEYIIISVIVLIWVRLNQL